MFQGKASYGMDMFSINIQRGRDNGVSPYINWRNICKLTPVANWSDLEEIMRPSSLHVLKNTYQWVSIPSSLDWMIRYETTM